MDQFPISHDGYTLLHEGALALSQIQLNGMKVDVPGIELEMKRIEDRIERTEKWLDTFDEIKLWKKTYGLKFNLDSPQQLQDILFNKLGLPPFKETSKSTEENRSYSTDEESLKSLNLPMVNCLLKRTKLSTAKNTFLSGIYREQVDGWLHPFFNILLVSYRSSSSNINFQNQPKHDLILKKLIRTKFLPRNKHRILGEFDYSKAEVIGSACYHKDPNMIAEITNPELDMHRDIAMECFLVDLGEMTGEIRFAGKNGFTFAQFYGDYYVACARALWNSIQQLDLKTKKGLPLYLHLKKKGIRNLEQFEKNIKEVERRFWEIRFKVYNKWKKDWYKLYQKQGFVDSLTGFRYSGFMTRNEVCNYPIQGSSFHFLLWATIQLQRIAVKEKWETKILGQIHDAIVFDFEPSEINHVVKTVTKVMCEDVRKHWPWIIVPLKVDLELAPAGESWYHLKKVQQTKSCSCGNRWNYNDSCPVCKKKL